VGSATASFEVATIKPSDPAAAGTPIGIAPGGIFQARNATLKSMIVMAPDNVKKTRTESAGTTTRKRKTKRREEETVWTSPQRQCP